MNYSLFSLLFSFDGLLVRAEQGFVPVHESLPCENAHWKTVLVDVADVSVLYELAWKECRNGRRPFHTKTVAGHPVLRAVHAGDFILIRRLIRDLVPDVLEIIARRALKLHEFDDDGPRIDDRLRSTIHHLGINSVFGQPLDLLGGLSFAILAQSQGEGCGGEEGGHYQCRSAELLSDLH